MAHMANIMVNSDLYPCARYGNNLTTNAKQKTLQDAVLLWSLCHPLEMLAAPGHACVLEASMANPGIYG
jgi:hypothetical protein